MCNYCGCRDFPLIARLTAEHETIADAAGRLRDAISDGGDAPARLDDLLALLLPHTSTEETGLFTDLRVEGSLTEAVDKLCAEHDDIHGVLGAVDRVNPDWPAVLAALEQLRPLATEVLVAIFQPRMTQATEKAFGRELDRRVKG